MTDFAAQTDDCFIISDQAGESAGRLYVQDWVHRTAPEQWTAARIGTAFDVVGVSLERGEQRPLPMVDRESEIIAPAAEDWFERVHVLPRSIDLGNILGVVQVDMEVYNAYRDDSRDFTNFTNNAGNGVSIIDLPGLPVTLNAQEGLQLTLEVTTDGPPDINGTLDFTFDIGSAMVPIEGSRIVLFPFRPEAPMVERLEFLTDIFVKIDGTEQRVALRKNPRQTFEMEIFREDGVERQRIDNMLFDWQARVFGVPVWFEPMALTADASIGQTTINVNTTNYADLRVGGLAVIIKDDSTFETLEIASIGPTTIGFASPLMQDHDASEVEVYPVRTTIAPDLVRIRRRAVNAETRRVVMRVLDNDSDLADTAAFSVYDSKVLFDDPNLIDGLADESMQRRTVGFDNNTGKFSQVSPWDRSRDGSSKGFFTRTRRQLWELRQVLHALRGRQVSFYVPTFAEEITPTATLTNGGSTLTMTNVGYAKFTMNRQPRDVIRIRLTDQTELIRTITDSSEVDADTEQLTVDTSWPMDITVGEIERIDFYRKVRFDTDSFTITHTDSGGQARTIAPVKAVLE